MDDAVEAIRAEASPPLSFIQRLMLACASRQKLVPGLVDEKEVYMGLKTLKLDYTIEANERAVKSIYKTLTGEEVCRTTGSHWEKIGFQHTDPATDVRGVGMLAIYQLLVFVERHPHKARRYAAHANSPAFEFPFAITMFKFSALSLNVLRDGRVFGQCNREDSVRGVMDDFYCGCVMYFMGRYIKEGATVVDVSPLEEQVTKEGRDRPGHMIELYRDGAEVERQKQRS